MNDFMNNDGGKEEWTPIYHDGQQVRFERMLEEIIQSNKQRSY